MLEGAAADLNPAVWGDVASWVSAIATVLAFAGAGWAVLETRRIYRLESARDQVALRERTESEAEARRRQAELVCAWPGSRADRANLDDIPSVIIRNASTLPVYDVRLSVKLDSVAELVERSLDVLPPSDSTTQVFLVEGRVPSKVATSRDPSDMKISVDVRFLDAAGITWHRSARGILTEVR